VIIPGKKFVYFPRSRRAGLKEAILKKLIRTKVIYSLFQNNEVRFFLPPAPCRPPQSDNFCTSLI